MNLKFMASMIVSFIAMESQAVPCKNISAMRVVDFDLTGVLSAPNNQAGQITEFKQQTNPGSMQGVCPKHTGNDLTYRTYRSIAGGIFFNKDKYNYIELNEYLFGALKIFDSWAGDFYPPIEYQKMGKHENVTAGKAFPIQDVNYHFKIVVKKPFVGKITIPKRDIMQVFITTSPGEPLGDVAYTISYSGFITAPQNCTVGTGTSLTINFGEIAANSFAQAGVGNKPANTPVEMRSIPIKCVNTDANALLKVRITSDFVEGDILKSDKKDIGFKVSDTNNKVLTPNNMNSTLPFKLNNYTSSVSLNFWPVSRTGKAPDPGPFKSTAYLRVDFE